MIYLLLINYLLVQVAESQFENFKCFRENITSEYDCERYYEGQSYWNSTSCVKNETVIDLVLETGEIANDPTYCNQIQSKQCSQNINCALINDMCQHFTGCSAFQKEKDEECQSISIRCISNGKQCVEIGSCDEYITQKSCQYDENGKYCYWDSINSKCLIAQNCEQFPKSLNTDQLCRDELNKCTVSQYSEGCVESGLICSDQLFQNQCFWNRDQTQECFWNGTSCVDKICQNALNTLKTDEQCMNYLSICTTKQDGGCVERSTCDSIQIQEACKKNQKGEACYWNGTKCLDKICINAPSIYMTNLECDQFQQNCITNGNGCIENVSCSSAKIEDACESDINNNKCVWSNNICQVAKCELAENSLISNADCSRFLIGCVSKKGGGCMKISKCSDYNIEEACLIDEYGDECFWNDKERCVNKTCENAPDKLQSHEECQNYNEICTLNSKTNQGCIDMICENISDEQFCIEDLDGNKCKYEKQCSSKECSLGKKTSAIECNKYLNKCTLNDDGNGCTQIPLRCRDNSKKQNCYYRQDGECGWDSQKNICVDKQCYTADINYNTNEQCETYLQGCVLSNTVGCMILPKLCQDRKRIENCHFDDDDDDCVWGLDQCQSRSCQTAQFELDLINMLECNQYIDCSQDVTQCCIINNDNNNCQNKSTCDILNKSNCINDAAIDGTCVWNGIKCINADTLECVDYIGQNHQQCYDLMNTCTINDDGNGCMQLKECEEYVNSSQCILNSNKEFCKWNSITNSCLSYTCTNAPDSYEYATDEQCRIFQSNCTQHPNIGGCVDKFNTCEQYLKKESCFKTISSTKNNCIWYNNQCKTINECDDINFITTYSTTNCQSILFECKVNQTNNGCILKTCNDYYYTTLEQCQSIGLCSINKIKNQCISIQDYCYQYTISDHCYYSKEEGLCISYKDRCVVKNYDCDYMAGDEITCPQYREACINNPNSSNCKRKNCQSQVPPKTTLADCQNFDKGCTAQIDLQQCTDIQDTCQNYSKIFNDLNLCYYSQSGYCVLMTLSGKDYCWDLFSIEQCSQIRYNYNQTCEFLSKWCTNNPDTQSTQQCIDKTCDNAVKSEYNHSTCQAWLNTCTSNYTHTGCTEIKDQCSDYIAPNCIQSNQGLCENVNNKCVLRQCNYSPSTLINNQVCESYLNICTVARIGGCVKRSETCELYLLQQQCHFDIKNNRCWWNPTSKNCVQLKCSNIEKTSSYSTNQQCQSIQYIDCILSNTGIGCQDNQQQCESFTSQYSCIVDIKGQPCQWNNNSCLTKTCTSAPNSLTTLEECLSYYTKVKCTTKTGGGCTFQLDLCESYTDQMSCIVTKKGVLCGYDQKNKKCQIKSCQTAPLSFSSHNQCYSYLNTCTVQTSGSGCQTIPKTCSEMTMIQCEMKYCYYDNDNNICINRTCQNKPDSITDCTEYFDQCYQDTIKCKTAICEYYFYKTDEECRNVIPNCTSDGYQCIPRKKCNLYTNEISCISQPDGQLCQWINSNQCQVRQCSVAPKSLVTHSQCQQYLNKCTTQKDGGCTNLMSCIEYSIQEQCQIDNFQLVCVWDLSKNYCRDKECKDYNGSNHKSCQSISLECTTDFQRRGYCMDFLNCSMYTQKLHCIIGSDGSCLWINDQCYKYSQCEDIQFKTHEECQQISEDCTTDGISCVPITFCKDTNTNGGCNIGIDGECIQIIQNGINSCALYESCNQITFTTHDQCYQNKNYCTTDGIQCISLNDCDKYTHILSCVFNSKGIIISNNRILSTGYCVWDISANKCRDQNCQDFIGITNDQCESQLYSCTSDGKKCVPKMNCSTIINQVQCLIAKSDDGYCFWSDDKCDLISCSNIIKPSSVQQCKEQNIKCTYDGQSCITVSECKNYKTQSSCNSKGIDGFCTWIPPISSNITTTVQRNKCELMKSCQQSYQDQNSCLQVKDVCYFKKATNTSSSQCQEHTCFTYYEQNKKCQFFYNWNKTLITLCQLQNNTCNPIVDPGLLSSKDCYLLSGYTYTYNMTTAKCQSCEPLKKNITITAKNKFVHILTIFLIPLLFYI